MQPYSPANHTGTKNFRLIGPETVGAKRLEVLVGEIGDEKFEMQAGEACFFPAGVEHVLVVTSERARVLVVYSPPYLETPG